MAAVGREHEALNQALHLPVGPSHHGEKAPSEGGQCLHRLQDLSRDHITPCGAGEVCSWAPSSRQGCAQPELVPSDGDSTSDQPSELTSN